MNYILVVFSLFFIQWSGYLSAQEINWNGNTNSISIGENVSLLEDSTRQLTIHEITERFYQSKFEQSTQEIIHLGFTESTFWLKFSVHNPDSEDLLLVMEQAFLPMTNLYLQNKNTGEWKVQKSGYQVPFEDKPFQSHYQIFHLPKGKYEVYVQFQSYTHPIPIKLWDAKNYKKKALQQKLSYAIIVGLFIFVILNNLFLFFSLKTLTYFHYALLVFQQLFRMDILCILLMWI